MAARIAMQHNQSSNVASLCTIDLRSVTTAADTNTNVDVGETICAQEQDGLKDLDADGLGLHELDRHTIDLEQALALLAISNSDCIALRCQNNQRQARQSR